MISEALYILWEYPSGIEDSQILHANHGDEEIFKKICLVAKEHFRIRRFIADTSYQTRQLKTNAGVRSYGLYGQALGEGISEVLKSFKKTLIQLEKQMNLDYTLLFIYGHVEKFQDLFNAINRIITSIKQRRLTGCQILSIIHQNILNCNETVHNAFLKIFSYINNVFINQLGTWLLCGELQDPYEEFFIYGSQNSSNSSDKSNVTTGSTFEQSFEITNTVLDCGYDINPSMIPHFMPLSLAQEILFIGKTVILFDLDPCKAKRKNWAKMNRSKLQKANNNHIRFTIWDDKEAEFYKKIQELKSPEGFEVFNLTNVVSEIKKCVTNHLWIVAVEETQLIHELRLMKDFFLLGRGELFLELLRLTAPMLDKPPTKTSTKQMNQAFQFAARAVFLSDSADIEKFSFELPYFKANKYVEPTADEEISAIIKRLESKVKEFKTQFGVQSFNMDESGRSDRAEDTDGSDRSQCEPDNHELMMRISSNKLEASKTPEHAGSLASDREEKISSSDQRQWEMDNLADGWSSIILKYDFKWPLHLLFAPEVLARYNDMFRLLLRIKKTQHDIHALWKTFKQTKRSSIWQLHNKLMFLIDNLQHYMQADVLETNFSRLMYVVSKINDFENLKELHASFLADILSQSFLTISPTEPECSGDTVQYLNNPVFCNIMEILDLCRSFCNTHELICNKDSEEYYIKGYSDRFDKLVKQLMQLLVSMRERPCGVYLARLLMRLDYNRWLSGEAQLTQSVTNILRY